MICCPWLNRIASISGNGVPARAFVHSYGPVADVMERFGIAKATGLPLWINRYGYLSDAKLKIIGEVCR